MRKRQKGCIKLHDKDLHNLLYLLTEKNEMGRSCTAHGIDENYYKILTCKTNKMRPLGDFGAKGRIINGS
jgi:hypothetical protein